MTLFADMAVGMLQSGLGVVLGGALGAMAYRWYTIRAMRPVLATTFRWYAELVFTIEYRLRRLSEAPRRAEDDDARGCIVRLRADIESALIANDQLQSSMDIPFRPRRVQTELARFASTSARLYSEMARAATLALGELDRDLLVVAGPNRYLAYLSGGQSPVTNGRAAKGMSRPEGSLKFLLVEHVNSLKALAMAVRINPSEGIDNFFDPKEMWSDWIPWDTNRAAER